jgi:hypothetical protein
MKNLFVLAVALALAACGNGSDAAEAPGEVVATAAAANDPMIGQFGGTTADGKAWTSAMNADGTYSETLEGEASENGTWTHVDDRVCFTPAPQDGIASPETCLTLLNVNDDGSLLMADAEGLETTVPRLEPAAAE